MKRNCLFFTLITAVLMVACSQGVEQKSSETQPEVPIAEVMDFAAKQYADAAERFKNEERLPYSGNADGSWEMVPPSDWMSGFFGGTLWYLYEYTGDTKFENYARLYTEKLESQQFMDRHHDIGFMMFSTYGNGYRLTGDTSYLPILRQSARTATLRYNPIVGTIKSWNKNPGEHPTIIDNMMNLELLVWAAEKFDEPELYEVAVNHADVTMKQQFRDNFSSYHVVLFDSATGTVVKRHTAQGYNDDSMWARGQAWGIYGYVMMYRFTQDEKYLERAMQNADIFIERLPKDWVPFWDFDAPDIPNTYRDASAGAIASSAFLELSTHLEGDAGEKYLNTAKRILAALSTDDYLAKGENYNCVLLHSAYSVPGDYMPDVNKSYADYYFLEALLRLKRIQEAEPIF